MAHIDRLEDAVRQLLTALERSAPADPGHGEIQWRQGVIDNAKSLLPKERR